MTKKILLIFTLALMGVNGVWAQELTAVSTETTWDFTSMSFSSSALETPQYLQDNTVYLGPGVIKNGRAAFTTALDAMPTALGNNMVAFKAGADGQLLIMVSTYRGYVSVSDGTSVVVDYNQTGSTYHDGGMAYYRHVFSVESGKTYYIYTTYIKELSGDKSDVGVIKMDYRPTGVNSTTAFSSTEVVNINVNANFPQITYQGITYDNVYVGQGVVYTNKRHTFGGATSEDSKNPTTYAFSFKLPAGKGSLYIDPSSYHSSSNYVKLSNGEEILLNMGKTAHHSESGDAAIAARTYAYESSTETTMYVYSTASGEGYGLYGITWTPTTHTYTINAVDGSGNLLQQLASATCIEGGDYSFVGVPKVVLKDGKYYVLNDVNVSGFSTPAYTMRTSDETKEITYTEDASIVYFAEMEDLNNTEGTGTGDGFSNGKYSETISGKASTLTTLGTGNYTITGCWRNNNNGNRGLYLRSSSSNTSANVLASMGDRYWSGEHSTDFSLTESTDLYLTGYTGDKSLNKSASLDYIIIRRASVPVTISSVGWATLYTAYPLDFTSLSADLTAYTATCSQNTVTLTPVENVPANTGVILKGTAKAYDIPVIASSSTNKGSLIGSATDATDCPATSGTYYILTKDGDKAQFNPATTGSIAAGKAYLQVGGSARTLSVVFADETTAISDATRLMNNEKIIKNGEVYDLQGRKVANPTKGLYIVNGTKMIVK